MGVLLCLMMEPTLPPPKLTWPPPTLDLDIMDITTLASVLPRPRLRLILHWLPTPTALLYLTMLLFMEDMDMLEFMVILTGVRFEGFKAEYCTNYTLDVSRNFGAAEHTHTINVKRNEVFVL